MTTNTLSRAPVRADASDEAGAVPRRRVGNLDPELAGVGLECRASLRIRKTPYRRDLDTRAAR